MNSAFRMETAVHPHWVSRLRLFEGGRLEQENYGRSTGTYEFIGSKLVVHWDAYGSESFSKVEDIFIHDSILKGTCPPQLAAVPSLTTLSAARLADELV